MRINFSFFAYGILAIAALALILAFLSNEVGNSGSAFYTLAVVIVLFFFLYMFMRLFKRGV